MSRLFLLAVTLAALFSTSFAAIDADLVAELPGYGKTPTKQYSGFLAADAKQTVFLHYWFVESSGNPATDPVLVWLNGMSTHHTRVCAKACRSVRQPVLIHSAHVCQPLCP